MTGKVETKRGGSPREVVLKVDGREVELNGFVRDVFQETVVGLIRALGTDDEGSLIELTIGTDASESGESAK